MKNTNYKKGFTLIELLVVISIIGLLSSVVLGAMSSAKKKANGAWVISQMKQIQNALELYKLDYGYYPYQRGVGGDPDSPNGIDAAYFLVGYPKFIDSLKAKLVPKYISEIKDNIGHDNDTVISFDYNQILNPSFEYQTEGILDDFTCGTIKPFGQYALFIMSTFPISGLDMVYYKDNGLLYMDNYYGITP